MMRGHNNVASSFIDVDVIMSYMGNIVSSSGSIQELNLDEVDQVSGGPLPLLAIAYAGIAIDAAVLIIGSAWVAGVHTGYNVNKKQ